MALTAPSRGGLLAGSSSDGPATLSFLALSAKMSPYQLARVSAAALLWCGLTGCSESTSPPIVEMADTFHVQGPIPPLAEFQAGEVVLGRMVYTWCDPPFGGWRMNWLPDDDPMLVDLLYRNIAHGGSFLGILPEDLNEIEQAGAEVLVLGELGFIRVRAARESLVWLTPHIARAVPDADRMDTRISVGYEDSTVLDAFEALGGEIVNHLAWINSFTGVIANGAIPAVLAIPDVRYVEPSGWLCPIR